MTQQRNEILTSPAVDKLVTLVEEATRATKDSPRRFIEPARGTLDRAKSRRHHIIFGRRGSGKTSLLRKAGADLTLRRTPVAFIDLEAFKGHTYPDVLISVLIETMTALDAWLGSAGSNPSSKTSYWKRFFGKPDRPPLKRERVKAVREALQKNVAELSSLLHAEDGAPQTSKESSAVKNSTSSATDVKGALSYLGSSASLGTMNQRANSSELSSEVTEQRKRDKAAFLHRRIIDFQKLFEQIVELSGSDAYIFLDDLYHIARRDQAHVLDYFHRILKGRSVWLKVGTIRHRTEWYHHGDPPIGLKLGDDCDDIDLDITLEKHELAKRFLLQILDQLITEAGLPDHNCLLADGGTERLVLASGGVARDFLTIFRKAIDVARERGKTYRGERINAEDVNMAAGEHDPSKRDELKRDTIGERARLEQALRAIQDFCLNNKVNCFLVERESGSRGQDLLGELVDLRFVHVVESRTTVRDDPGKLYTGYMLDISQYTGERRRRELQMIEFWKRDEVDRIRRSKYVLDLDSLSRAV
ncbi:MAG: hypothetical protein LAP39_01855 [Acidobacteriia bacterium]|nr:hypothetical protein [Terriglobia bacterium]